MRILLNDGDADDPFFDGRPRSLTALLFPIGTLAAESDSKIAFNDHCRECHSFLKGDNRLGPTLYGTVGRKAGSIPDFPFPFR